MQDEQDGRVLIDESTASKWFDAFFADACATEQAVSGQRDPLRTAFRKDVAELNAFAAWIPRADRTAGDLLEQYRLMLIARALTDDPEAGEKDLEAEVRRIDQRLDRLRLLLEVGIEGHLRWALTELFPAFGRFYAAHEPLFEGEHEARAEDSLDESVDDKARDDVIANPDDGEYERRDNRLVQRMKKKIGPNDGPDGSQAVMERALKNLFAAPIDLQRALVAGPDEWERVERWIASVIRSEAIEYYRKRARQQRHLPQIPLDDAVTIPPGRVSFDELEEIKLDIARVAQEAEAANPEEWNVFVENAVYGTSQRDIGNAYGGKQKVRTAIDRVRRRAQTTLGIAISSQRRGKGEKKDANIDEPAGYGDAVDELRNGHTTEPSDRSQHVPKESPIGKPRGRPTAAYLADGSAQP